MKQLSLRGWAFILTTAVWALGTPAAAQRVTGPYQGLFGAGPERRENGQSLELRGSLFGSWDDIVGSPSSRSRAPVDQASQGAVGLTADPEFLGVSTGAGAQGGVTYSRRSEAARFSLGGNSEVRVFPQADDFKAVLHSAESSLDINVGPNAVVRTTGSGSYSSFYQFAPFLGAETGGVSPLSSGFAFASAEERNARVAAGAGTVVTLSRRSTLSADAEWTQWRFLDHAASDIETRSGRGTLTYQLTRAMGLRAGYGYQQGQYNVEFLEPVTLHSIDAGIDYGDTLQFTRRTALSFSTSTSAVRIDNRTHFRLEGAAGLTRGFRRTWSSALRYARTTTLAAGLRGPVLSDSVNGDVGGLLSRRVMWSSGVGYSHGNVGFGTENSFSTVTGTSRLGLAITGRLSVYGQYTYYRYRVPPGSTVTDSVPKFARQTVTTGLAVWLPVIDR